MISQAIAYPRHTGSHDGSSNICVWTWVMSLAKDPDKVWQTWGIQVHMLDLGLMPKQSALSITVYQWLIYGLCFLVSKGATTWST